MIFRRIERIKSWITWKVLTLAMHVSVQGLENVPSSGLYILTWNRLHFSDRLLLYILVRHGTIDHQAVRRALEILKKDNPVAIAPEGRVSRTGALCRAENGVASLVCHSGATVIPVAIWGQFQAHNTWLRLRRPRVVIRYGAAMNFPRRRANHLVLQELTTEIMTGLARTLPAEYRGFYGQVRRKPADKFIQTFTEYRQYSNSYSGLPADSRGIPSAPLPEQEESEVLQ